MDCCGAEKTRGPNVYGFLTCPIHCSKCGHDRKYEDHLDFCWECKITGPCGYDQYKLRKRSNDGIDGAPEKRSEGA